MNLENKLKDYQVKRHEIRRTEKISSCTKNSIFLQLAAEKDTIFEAARKFFSPSYFVTALPTPVIDKIIAMKNALAWVSTVSSLEN